MFIKKKTRCFFPRLFFRTGKAILGISDLTGIRGLTVIHCGIRKNEKFLNGVRDDHHLEKGFAQILVRDVIIFGIEVSDVRDAGLSRKRSGIAGSGSFFSDPSKRTLTRIQGK